MPSFRKRNASGAFTAIRPANSIASFSNWSCGTVRETSPMRAASAAPMTSPVNNSSAAFCGPTMRGRIIMPPTSVTRPRLMKISPNCALSEAMRISANSVSSIPQPTATPFTAAMIGRSHARTASAAGVRRGLTAVSRAWLCSRAGPVIICLTSSPEQKAGSVPVSTTHLTSPSFWMWRNAASSSA